MTKRLPGLDFVRFYAALSVVIYHVVNQPGVDWSSFAPPVSGMQWVFLHGDNAVTLFFVLSGFLITYLLLHEKAHTRTINVKAFYQRRALRILPLYYLVVFIGYLVIPLFFPYASGHPPQGVGNVLPFLLVMPLFTATLDWRHCIAHLWSIGVEELYYWFIPNLVRLAKWIPLLLLAVIVARWGFYAFAEASGHERLQTWAMQLRFDCMAVGGLGAWLAYRDHFLLRVLYHRLFQIVVFVLFVFSVLIVQIGAVNEFLNAWIYMAYILNVATNPKALGRIDFRWTPILGNISYGMYMFHPFILYAFAQTLPPSQSGTMLVGTIVLTLIVAWASYRFVETPFNRLRHRFIALPSPIPATAG